jgi:hypothetical protein
MPVPSLALTVGVGSAERGFQLQAARLGSASARKLADDEIVRTAPLSPELVLVLPEPERRAARAALPDAYPPRARLVDSLPGVALLPLDSTTVGLRGIGEPLSPELVLVLPEGERRAAQDAWRRPDHRGEPARAARLRDRAETPQDQSFSGLKLIAASLGYVLVRAILTIPYFAVTVIPVIALVMALALR